MYGSWFPSVSTDELVRVPLQRPGRRVDRRDRLPGRQTTGRSGLSAQSFLNLNRRTQLSNLASFACWSSSASADVLRVELLQVVGGREAAHAASCPPSAWPARGRWSRPGRRASRKYGSGNLNADGVGRRPSRSSPGLPLIVMLGDGRRHQILVLVDVLEPEHEVVGGERLAVRPLHALAQVHDERPAAVLHLPRPWRCSGRSCCRCSPRTADCRAASSIRLPFSVVGRAGEAAPPGAAVLADLVERLDDQRLLRRRAARPAAACRP